MRSSAASWLIMLLLHAGMLAAGEAPTVGLQVERKVGYMIGDLVPYQAIVQVDPSWTLRRSSLPAPGRPQYWLELRSVDVGMSGDVKRRIYAVRLIYQLFYAPIEARKRTLPGFVLTFDHDGTSTDVTVPELSVTMSPLREVASGTGDPEENVALEPDRAPPEFSLRAPLIGMLACGLVAVLTLVFIAWQRAFWPFTRRRGAYFATAARELRRANPRDPASYASGLLTMHRAFDSVAGWHVFADDLPRFLEQNPRFSQASAEIADFFRASRYQFFGEDTIRSNALLPFSAVRGLAGRLAALDRQP